MKASGQSRAEQNIIRVGVVSSFEPADGTARVAFDDRAGLVTYPCQQILPFSGKNNSSRPPDIGEQVLCLFLPNGQQTGFILGTFTSRKHPAPAETGDGVYITDFSDGTRLKYDRNRHSLSATFASGSVLEYDEAARELRGIVQGKALLDVTDTVTINAPNGIFINANITINGWVRSSGDQTAGTVSQMQHRHTQSGGTGTGGIPVQ